MRGRTRAALTRFYAMRWGGVTESEEYTVGEVSRTVFWFCDESNRMGDYSPIGTLLLNEHAKNEFSEDVVDYVFLHEVGHDRMGFVGRTLFWVFYLVFGLLFFSAVLALPSVLDSAILNAPSTPMIVPYMVVAVGIIIAACLPFVVVSWIDETLAELFAISKIGRSQYRTIFEETRGESEDGLLYSFRHRVQYPPQSFVLWVSRKRAIGGED